MARPDGPGCRPSESERWLAIPGYDGRYDVSDAGRVRNTSTGFILNPYLLTKYLSVSLRKDGEKRARPIHLLVLLAFHGPKPEGHAGAHLNGNSHDNSASNLSWVTYSENERHKLAHGTHKIGIRSPHAKFGEVEVKVIREAHSLGLSVHKIGLLTGVAGSTIANIVNGVSYEDI